jgi:hypothetical protein
MIPVLESSCHWNQSNYRSLAQLYGFVESCASQTGFLLDPDALHSGFVIHSCLPVVSTVGSEAELVQIRKLFPGVWEQQELKVQESAQAQGRLVETREKLQKTSHPALRVKFTGMDYGMDALKSMKAK